jgi:hypothetical protein
MRIAQVALAIKVGSDPIEGSLTTSEHGSRSFYGWVELAAAIDAVRGAPASEPLPRVSPRKD